jgi:hypothetical protein
VPAAPPGPFGPSHRERGSSPAPSCRGSSMSIRRGATMAQHGQVFKLTTATATATRCGRIATGSTAAAHGDRRWEGSRPVRRPSAHSDESSPDSGPEAGRRRSRSPNWSRSTSTYIPQRRRQLRSRAGSSRKRPMRLAPSGWSTWVRKRSARGRQRSRTVTRSRQRRRSGRCSIALSPGS